MILQENDVILFQGDSITDCGRDRGDYYALGTGYPLIVAALLRSRFPRLNLTILNRGVSGDRAADLARRWSEDCVALRPDVLSILVGVNDTWRAFDSGDPTDAAVYEAHYRQLLDRARNEADVREIVLLEPFVLPVPPDRKLWRTDLNPRIEIVRELAREYNAALIPTDGLFAHVSAIQPPAYWAEDGVHPTVAGHGLIARAWVELVS